MQNNIISILWKTQFPTRIDDTLLPNGVSIFPVRSIINPKELARRYMDGNKSTEQKARWWYLFFSRKQIDSVQLAGQGLIGLRY